MATNMMDGTIEKAVKEIDGVLEEMRELAFLQGPEGGGGETTADGITISEAYSDDDEDNEDGGRNLALELHEADASFRLRNTDKSTRGGADEVIRQPDEKEKPVVQVAAEDTGDPFQAVPVAATTLGEMLMQSNDLRETVFHNSHASHVSIGNSELNHDSTTDSSDSLEMTDDVEDRPIALSIGERGTKATATNTTCTTTITTSSWYRIGKGHRLSTTAAHQESFVSNKDTGKNKDDDDDDDVSAKRLSKKRLRRRTLRLAGLSMASIGLVILVITLAVLMRAHSSSSSSRQQESSSSYDPSLFVPDPEFQSAELTPTLSPMETPTTNNNNNNNNHPTNDIIGGSSSSSTTTTASPYRVSRFPSQAPIADTSLLLTDLPSVAVEDDEENTWEPDLEMEEEDENDSYYEGKSKKGKGGSGSGPAIAYREWE